MIHRYLMTYNPRVKGVGSDGTIRGTVESVWERPGLTATISGGARIGHPACRYDTNLGVN
jgi:hypothetical protein